MHTQKKKKYVGTLTSGALLSVETRQLAPYLLQDLSLEEWKQLFATENPLQKRTVSTSLRYYRTIFNRFSVLGAYKSEFIRSLLVADREAFNQLLLLLIVLESPIVGDFMQNALRPRVKLLEESLPENVWEEFVRDRAYIFPELLEYTEQSLQKIGRTVIRILVDVGYLNNAKERILQAVYLTAELEEWLLKLGRFDLKGVFECTI